MVCSSTVILKHKKLDKQMIEYAPKHMIGNNTSDGIKVSVFMSGNGNAGIHTF